MLRPLARPAGVAALLLALAATSACGGGEDDDRRPSAGRSGSPSVAASAGESATSPSGASSYLPVPDGVTLTPPGTALSLGAQGVVAFERRQGQVGVLGVEVRRIEPTTFKRSFAGWSIDPTTAASRIPYFVRVRVTNLGDLDLGGLKLDSLVYADDGATLEAPSYYLRTQLPRCVGGPLPRRFAKGASVELCQVYYLPRDRRLEAIAFPPFGGAAPITWSGPYSKVGRVGAAPPKAVAASGSATPSPSATSSASSARPTPTPTPSRSVPPPVVPLVPAGSRTPTVPSGSATP
ncbi:hypothetical protein [Nocardioides sp.]|uniref:hypothetical protein n=1 Tax=Nocardioides sp. TaxID=35761 RepID=UPI003513638A